MAEMPTLTTGGERQVGFFASVLVPAKVPAHIKYKINFNFKHRPFSTLLMHHRKFYERESN